MSGVVADVTLVVQAALVLTVLEALRRQHGPALLNTTGALAFALLPAGLHAATGLVFGHELPLWIALAGFIHALGMLELYDRLWWWDHLTHTVSAALVTALAYAGAIVLAAAGRLGPLAPLGAVGVTVGLLLLFTVLWELLEEFAHFVADRYDIRPLLVVYGPFDAVFDLAFNLVGAGVVLLLDLRLFVPVFEPHPHETAALFGWLGGLALLSVVALAGSMALIGDDWP